MSNLDVGADGWLAARGVCRSAAATDRPLHQRRFRTLIRCRVRLTARTNPSLNAEAVTPGYFDMMRIPLLRGRPFTEYDTQDSDPVVIVSLAAARRLWPGQDPIGKNRIASYIGRRETGRRLSVSSAT